MTQESMAASAAEVQVFDMDVATAGGNLSVRCWHPASSAADQPPIILLHDSLGCVALWREFPAHLAGAAQRRVIAYDRLGFGLSDPYPGTLPLDFIEREATSGFAALLQHLQVDHFIVLGHSVGGCMAVNIAGAFAERCDGLITLATMTFVEQQVLDGIREAQQLFAQPGQLEKLEKYHGGKARWVLDSWINTWQSDAFADWNLDNALPQVQCPALAIHGDSDEYGSIVHPQRIVERVAGAATLLELHGCGHVPHREKEGPVLRAIGRWLADE
ncbi:alpha/beta hydrolase [Pokkaliibacter sp. MBI-7]|uniref:alpha/beta fold hydrolase n=1 Tax=Pokkaliibacter sp. MBI-7 TaxID=3040600 RepID=UPI0024469A7E|nr:alpha/beta hydrolase [Pokkaliibacter sp. MBI-7]MDH2435276.1 alpha/beta hydrolase [Pokkaliibacter sp. MBI-7]